MLTISMKEVALLMIYNYKAQGVNSSRASKVIPVIYIYIYLDNCRKNISRYKYISKRAILQVRSNCLEHEEFFDNIIKSS
jgi:hypothetical protein